MIKVRDREADIQYRRQTETISSFAMTSELIGGELQGLVACTLLDAQVGLVDLVGVACKFGGALHIHRSNHNMMRSRLLHSLEPQQKGPFFHLK